LAYERTLVQIRERTFLEVLDLALAVIRHRPLTIALAAVAGIAPFAFLNDWLMTDPDFPFGVFLLLLLLEAPWATAPLTIVLGGLMFGEEPRVGRVLKILLRALPSMFVFQGLLRLFLICTLILLPLLPSRLSFLNEVILLERGKFWSPIRRCSVLSGFRGGDLFGQALALLFFGILFVLCFWMGTGAALSALTTTELTWETPGWADAIGLRFQLGVWLAIVFFGVARFLTYIDQRIRIEGWEVELRLRGAGKALEEASRW
jgi:hypothetical protein